MIGPKKHLRPSHPRPQGPAEGAAGAFIFSRLALSVTAIAVPPLPKGEALAKR